MNRASLTYHSSLYLSVHTSQFSVPSGSVDWVSNTIERIIVYKIQESAANGLAATPSLTSTGPFGC